MFIRHQERHRTERIGWLRAAVLGANDGIVSTASLIVGVAAAKAASGDILIAGVAGLVAGAMSMAAGEYVSVSSQADTEKADLDRERKELAADGEFERIEPATNSNATEILVCGCVICQLRRAARALHFCRPEWLDAASNGADLQVAIFASGGLSEAIRRSMLALVGYVLRPTSNRFV